MNRTLCKESAVLGVVVCAAAQVFDGGLPPHLPLVWNPRLTSTAGQVVDDGSHNRHKASREERIPVRLELSTKVGSGHSGHECANMPPGQECAKAVHTLQTLKEVSEASLHLLFTTLQSMAVWLASCLLVQCEN